MVPVTKSVDGATDATNDDALAKNSNRVIDTSAEVPVWDSMLLTKVMVRSPALSTVPPVLDRINWRLPLNASSGLENCTLNPVATNTSLADGNTNSMGSVCKSMYSTSVWEVD